MGKTKNKHTFIYTCACVHTCIHRVKKEEKSELFLVMTHFTLFPK